MKPLTKTLWIVFFALAMGYLETSVVVYLRALYYPDGFAFPLKSMDHQLAFTELCRELATLIMILAVSVLAARQWLHRFAWFLMVFAVWDIAYYLFLKLILGWPASLLTTDILFLLPSMWTGPVLAPLINSLTMILLSIAILRKGEGSTPLTRLSTGTWVLLIAGSFIVLASYLEDFAGFMLKYKHSYWGSEASWNEMMMQLTPQFVPRAFNWLLFSLGEVMHLTAVAIVFFSVRKKT
jgi:hypothetical protein